MTDFEIGDDVASTRPRWKPDGYTSVAPYATYPNYEPSVNHEAARGALVRGTGRKSLFVLALFGVVACADSRSDLPRAVISDSAGVRLISYDLTDIAVTPHRLLGDHDLEIGALDGDAEYAFSQISDLALTPGGSVIVSDALGQELRLFDRDGNFVRAIGGPGGGPGEFSTAPTITGVSGDTVAAFDRQASRITFFDLSGRMLGTVSLRTDAIGAADALIRMADGTYAAQSRWVDPDAATAFHEMRLELDSAVIMRLASNGDVLDTVQIMPDRTRARIVQDAGGGRVRTMQANSPYSVRAVIASPGVGMIVGHSGVFELRFFGMDSSLDAILRVRGVDHPATAREIRAHQEAAIAADIGDQELDPNVRRLNLDFLPERLPSFTNVLVSDGGDVWVGLSEYDLSSGMDWLVFEPTGALLGSVHTPPELRLRAVRADYVVGFVLDELDVPFVRRYPLRMGFADGH